MFTINLSKALAMAMVFALATSCASGPKVRVDKDPNTNFAAYKTFAWLAPQKEAPKEEPKPIAGKESAPPTPPETNSLVENRVRTAVIAALQAKGCTLNEAQPDFRVSYVLNAYEKPKESGMRIGIGAGGSSGNVGGGVGLSIPIGKRTNLMGAMTIDIVDAARNAQVWTGSYEDKVEGDGISDATAQKLVNTILARFPTDTTK
jgi:hypothetical protein